MPLWRRREPTPQGGARVLTASGERIDFQSREQLRALSATRMQWQHDAFAYRSMITELRFGLQFMAHSVAKCGFYPTQVNHDGGDPIPFDSNDCTLSDKTKKAAQAAHELLPLAAQQFVSRMVGNLLLVGECYVHGYPSKVTGRQRWSIRSIAEVQFNGDDGAATLTEGLGVNRPIDQRRETLLRLWVPDDERAWLADSPMRSLLDVCEEVVLAGREQRAASRSRIASNGILLVPKGMTLMSNQTDEDGTPIQRGAADSRFVQDLMAAGLAPIQNEGDPGSVMPVVLVGDPEDLEKLRHLAFTRDASADLGGKIERGIRRIATGLDMPGEMVTGLGDSNHWSAWMIDASTARYHVGPWTDITGDSLSGAYLRPACLRAECDPDEVEEVQYGVDMGPITENPNRREDAKDAWDRGLISDERARGDLGYEEGDKPTDKEIVRRLAWRIGTDTSTAARMLDQVLAKSSGMHEVIEVGRAQAPLPPGNDGDERGQLPPGQDQGDATGPQGANTRGGGTPNDGTPAGGRAGEASGGDSRYSTPTGRDPLPVTQRATVPQGLGHLAASATPDDLFRVDVDACRALTELERHLRERLLQACDDAIERAVEKAGARARSAARAARSEELAAALDGVPAELVPATLATALQAVPPEQRPQLNLDTAALLADAFDALRPKWTRWLTTAVDGVMRGARRILAGGDRDRYEQARAAMLERIDAGWAVLRAHLEERAERQLWKPGQPDGLTEGERPDTVTYPGGVRRALAVVGGEDPDRGTGLANGTEVRSLMGDQGADELGYEWTYGVIPRRPFHPHREMHLARFGDWTDERLATLGTGYEWVGTHFHPGDHEGCLCDYTFLFAVELLGRAADTAREQERVATEDNTARRNHQLLLDSDRRDGRTRTTATASEAERQQVLDRVRWSHGIREERGA